MGVLIKNIHILYKCRKVKYLGRKQINEKQINEEK
jgi:hypothetical protein